MTVAELIEKLQKADPNARVMEDMAGEIREVENCDYTECEIDPGDEFIDRCGEVLSGKFVIFSAWE